MTTENKTQAITKTDPATSLRKMLAGEYLKKQMALALPKHLTPDRMARTALTALMRQPKLLECDQSSFTLAMMQLSQWGLEPDGRRAHLVPFWNGKARRLDVVAMPDYKGLAELVLDGGSATSIHCDVVCEHDDFDFNLGQITRHAIDFRKPRGEPFAAYCIVEMKEGKPKCEVMTREEIEGIRDRSQSWISYKAGKAPAPPWETYASEMWKKTVFKRATKWLKLGSRAQAAVEADDHRGGPIQHVDIGSTTIDIAASGPVEQIENSEPSNPDEVDESEAGLAPVTPQQEIAKPKPESASKGPKPVVTPQQEIANFIESDGHTFDLFLRLAEREGWLQDATSFPDWDSLPTAEIKRILRARVGLKAGLEQLAASEGGDQ